MFVSVVSCISDEPEGPPDKNTNDLGDLFPPSILDLVVKAGFEVLNHEYGEITIICYAGRWVQVDTIKHTRPPKNYAIMAKVE